MKEFEKLKAEYDATPIPQELNDRIQQVLLALFPPFRLVSCT